MYGELNEEGEEDIELYTVEVEDSVVGVEEIIGAQEEYVEEREEGDDSDDDDDYEDGGEPMPVLVPQQQRSQVVVRGTPLRRRRVVRRQPQQRKSADPKESYQHKFSAREKWILAELVDHCRGILLSKSGKSDVRQRKVQLWNDVTEEINSQCGRNRPAEHLKKLWEYLASRARKMAMQQQQKRIAGEPPIYISPLMEKVISILYANNTLNLVVESTDDGGYKAVEVEADVNPEDETKIDWIRAYGRSAKSDQQHEQSRNAVDEMRKLLLTTHPIKPRKRTDAQQNKKQKNPEPLFVEEVAYDEIVELQQEVAVLRKRMLETREMMLVAKAEADVAKKVKMEAENYNLTLETLKLKYVLGDLNVDFAANVKVEKTEPDANAASASADDDDEVEIEM